jgi:hypothetical protein
VLQLAQVTNEDEASYQRVRQGLIEFVDQLDHLLLMVSKHGASNRRFVKTVTDVVSSIMDRPPLRRLRGRAREATKAEIIEAAAELVIVCNEEGHQMTQTMSDKATGDDYLDRSVTNSLKSALDNFNRRN